MNVVGRGHKTLGLVQEGTVVVLGDTGGQGVVDGLVGGGDLSGVSMVRKD